MNAARSWVSKWLPEWLQGAIIVTAIMFGLFTTSTLIAMFLFSDKPLEETSTQPVVVLGSGRVVTHELRIPGGSLQVYAVPFEHDGRPCTAFIGTNHNRISGVSCE